MEKELAKHENAFIHIYKKDIYKLFLWLCITLLASTTLYAVWFVAQATYDKLNPILTNMFQTQKDCPNSGMPWFKHPCSEEEKEYYQSAWTTAFMIVFIIALIGLWYLIAVMLEWLAQYE
jgi:hypothetical protein